MIDLYLDIINGEEYYSPIDLENMKVMGIDKRKQEERDKINRLIEIRLNDSFEKINKERYDELSSKIILEIFNDYNYLNYKNNLVWFKDMLMNIHRYTEGTSLEHLDQFANINGLNAYICSRLTYYLHVMIQTKGRGLKIKKNVINTYFKK